MKIIVLSLEKQPTTGEVYEFSSDNRSLIDAAFDIQNFRLASLSQTEPIDEGVSINVFYDSSGHIRWAFGGTTSEEAQQAIRAAMK